MASIAINILWLLIGVICLCGVIYLAFYILRTMGVPIPDMVEKAVWLIVLLLVLIFLISTLVGGSVHAPFLR